MLGRRSLLCVRHYSLNSSLVNCGIVTRKSQIPEQFSRRPLQRIVLPRKGLLTSKIFGRKFVTYADTEVVAVKYRHDVPVISVVLPSSKERCFFALYPVFHTVGQFLQDLEAEDTSITKSAICTVDGDRISSSTYMDHVLKDAFRLKINDSDHTVHPPPCPTQSTEQLKHDDPNQVLNWMHSPAQIDQYCAQQEQQVTKKLKELNAQIQPLEKVKMELEKKARSRTTFLMWGGLAYMAVQFGVLARLTWWEYSWDIMEPVTYFITYATTMAMYGYFLLTRQEYIYADASERQRLRFFHKAAQQSEFDVDHYNVLKHQIFQANRDLRSLRDLSQSKLQLTRPYRGSA